MVLRRPPSPTGRAPGRRPSATPARGQRRQLAFQALQCCHSQHTLRLGVDDVNTCRVLSDEWSKKRLRTVKPEDESAYHHGDLERALVDTAVRMIRDEGVEALTLRGVGARLGVSRTALYRHFDDKQALLARVAAEGFRRFHEALAAAAAKAEAAGADPMPAMAAAYVRFARANPSHYQTMFSGVLTDGAARSRICSAARRSGVQRPARHHPPRPGRTGASAPAIRSSSPRSLGVEPRPGHARDGESAQRRRPRSRIWRSAAATIL